jgi:hypothetical protein
MDLLNSSSSCYFLLTYSSNLFFTDSVVGFLRYGSYSTGGSGAGSSTIGFSWTGTLHSIGFSWTGTIHSIGSSGNGTS